MAETHLGGNGDRPVDGHDWRVDDFFSIVLVGSRDVAGQDESWKASDGHIGRTADTELVHSAAPDRDIPAQAVVVDAFGFE